MIALLAGALALASPGCDLAAAVDAPFAEALAPMSTERAPLLVIEIRAAGASPEWLTAVLGAVEARDLRAVVVVPANRDAIAPLAPFVEGGHEFALAYGAPPGLGAEPTFEVRGLRNDVRLARRLLGVRPRAASSPLPRRMTEAVLGLAGYRVLLDDGGAASSLPRAAAGFEGQLATTVILPPGPYHGACGSDPAAAPFTPRAADRATMALRGATAAKGGVVRVALGGPDAGPDDGVVLGRWLDEIVLPAGVRGVTATEVRELALAAPPDPDQEPSGRFVTLDDVRAAAEALRDVRTVPRDLPGGLVPSEAFLAFALVLAERAEGDVVRLQALSGPRSAAGTDLRGIASFERDEVTGAARALLVALPESVPASFPVGTRLLTASEVLLLFASAVRGDDPPTTRPVAVPEPNEDGLGWGVSGP